MKNLPTLRNDSSFAVQFSNSVSKTRAISLFTIKIIEMFELYAGMPPMRSAEYQATIQQKFLIITVFFRLSALGAYWIFGHWEWALIRGWALIKFSPFSTSVVCIFCKNTVITKREDVTKQGFWKTPWRKLRLRRSLKLVIILFFGW